MKKFLLIFAILFVPCSGFADVPYSSVVISSSEILDKKFLPLDTDALYDARLEQNFHNYDCDPYDLINSFMNKEIVIPFSVRDLMNVCRKNVVSHVDQRFNKICQIRCSNFALEYYRLLIEKTKKEKDRSRKEMQQKVHNYIWNKK